MIKILRTISLSSSGLGSDQGGVKTTSGFKPSCISLPSNPPSVSFPGEYKPHGEEADNLLVGMSGTLQ